LVCGACGFRSSKLAPGAGLGIDGLEALRRRNFEILLDRMEGFTSLAGARVLEVGAAKGWFLTIAKARGACASGIEPDSQNAAHCRDQGLLVETGFFPADLKASSPYDIIVFNDVFEHLPMPATLPNVIERLLKPGGCLVVNLPSSDGFFYRVAEALDQCRLQSPLERLWQKDFPSPHLSYFNRRNLRQLVEKNSQLREIGYFTLPTVMREGLSARVRSSNKGPSGRLMVATIWGLSFLLPFLPADIMVCLFRKPNAAA
jgi:SAM-dependent methyltransferase